jgi:hypothetical protein
VNFHPELRRRARPHPRCPLRLHDSHHRDEKPVTATPLDSAFTNRDARNPFRPLRLRAAFARRIRFYENCWVSPGFLNFSTFKPANMPTGFDLSPVFSYSSALFSATEHRYPLCFHIVAYSFYRNGGVPPRPPSIRDKTNQNALDSTLADGLPCPSVPRDTGHDSPACPGLVGVTGHFSPGCRPLARMLRFGVP